MPLFVQISSLPLHTVDLVILVLSIVAVTLFGMYVGRKEEGTSDYFLAGKSVAWWAVKWYRVSRERSMRHPGVRTAL
jgi:hypothetical protein